MVINSAVLSIYLITFNNKHGRFLSEESCCIITRVNVYHAGSRAGPGDPVRAPGVISVISPPRPVCLNIIINCRVRDLRSSGPGDVAGNSGLSAGPADQIGQGPGGGLDFFL